ncbi:GLPGLI family protein [Sphingobacterium kitahiroshimense]|uniref:GLPGLI family protein n=1 Tax=Sphingobacterium kitahiroshimense TaxID=470446 RepID=A0ABV0BVP3_9SPHI
MKLILTCLLATAALSTYSQTADKVLARVHYNFIHMQDTSRRDQLHREEMSLIIGKNVSLYTSGLKIEQAKKIRSIKATASTQMTTKATAGKTVSIAAKASTATSNDMPTMTDYYFFSKEQMFYTKEQIINEYLVQENAPKITWKVIDETRSVSGIPCQKAITYFKGRNWIAWYAPELPFQSGPWKLNGLPGLIIEAYDENQEVQFRFAGIENVKVDSNQTSVADSKFETAGMRPEMKAYMEQANLYLGNEIKLPEHVIKTDVKHLNKLKKAMEQDPEGFFKAQMNGSATSAVRISIPTLAGGGGTISASKINNPIEKDENK